MRPPCLLPTASAPLQWRPRLLTAAPPARQRRPWLLPAASPALRRRPWLLPVDAPARHSPPLLLPFEVSEERLVTAVLGHVARCVAPAAELSRGTGSHCRHSEIRE